MFARPGKPLLCEHCNRARVAAARAYKAAALILPSVQMVVLLHLSRLLVILYPLIQLEFSSTTVRQAKPRSSVSPVMAHKEILLALMLLSVQMDALWHLIRMRPT